MPGTISSLYRLAVASSEAAPRDVEEQLFREEIDYLRRAVPKRRHEFGTARVCARQALAELGVAPLPLVPNPDRSPWWPDGIVGTISHTFAWCAAVVARRSAARSLGLDIEIVRSLEPALADRIMNARERAFVAAQEPSQSAALLMLHFSAKEAYYKCQYPITHAFLGFHDVELEIDLKEQVFFAKALPDLPDEVRRMGGRFLFLDGSVVCGVELAP